MTEPGDEGQSVLIPPPRDLHDELLAQLFRFLCWEQLG